MNRSVPPRSWALQQFSAWFILLLSIAVSFPIRADVLPDPIRPESSSLRTCLGEQICADYTSRFPAHALQLVNLVLEQVYALPADEKRYLLEQRRDAVGFAIFPAVQRRGFMVASLFGKGILSYKNEDGNWSPPILLTMQGQSTGPLYGSQSSNIIFTFRTACGLRDFLSAHHHVRLSGFETSIEHVEHATEPLDITVHSFDRGGAMLGQSYDTYSILIDEEVNAELYGVVLKPGCLVEGARIGPKAPWPLHFIENLQLEPGEANRIFNVK